MKPVLFDNSVKLLALIENGGVYRVQGQGRPRRLKATEKLPKAWAQSPRDVQVTDGSYSYVDDSFPFGTWGGLADRQEGVPSIATACHRHVSKN